MVHDLPLRPSEAPDPTAAHVASSYPLHPTYRSPAEAAAAVSCTSLASSLRALTAAVGVAITPQEGDRVMCVELAIPGLPPVLITQDDADRLAGSLWEASTDAREANDPGARRG